MSAQQVPTTEQVPAAVPALSDQTVAKTSRTRKQTNKEFVATMEAVTGLPQVPVAPVPVPQPAPAAKAPAKRKTAAKKKTAAPKKKAVAKKAPAKKAAKKAAPKKHTVTSLRKEVEQRNKTEKPAHSVIAGKPKSVVVPEPNLLKGLQSILPSKKPVIVDAASVKPVPMQEERASVLERGEKLAAAQPMPKQRSLLPEPVAVPAPALPPQLYRVEFDFKKDGELERRSKTFVSREDAQRLYDQKAELGKKPALFPFGPSQLQKPTKQIESITITFDFKKNGEIERRTETFTDSQEADNFFNAKKEKGKDPKLTINYTYTKAPVHKPTLAEVFPVEVSPNAVDPRKDPTRLQAAGDPTVTTQVLEPVLTDKQRKAAKKLRKQQRRGEQLWRTKGIKTIVGARYGKEEGWEHARWFLKFDDGTEDVVGHLSIMYTRENLEHHLRVAGTCYIDGLSNKDYEGVIAQCKSHAQKAATLYGKMLTAFRGTDAVGMEIEKKQSKKALKAEVPLTPKQVELATKIADLANHLCCSPSMFFRLPAYQKKHWVGGAENIRQLDLDTHGIDETECSIQIMQHATRLHNGMTPRLEIGGPQIGTPELSAAHEKAKDKPVKAPKEKKERVVKEAAELDAWKNRVGTQAADINKALFVEDRPKLITTKWLKTRCSQFDDARLTLQFAMLVKKGFLVKLEKGYCVPGDEAAARKDIAKLVKEKPAKAAKAKAAEEVEQDEDEDTFIVKYDFRKDGTTERRRKVFEDRKEARKFFKEKQEAGKNPKFIAT